MGKTLVGLAALGLAVLAMFVAGRAQERQSWEDLNRILEAWEVSGEPTGVADFPGGLAEEGTSGQRALLALVRAGNLCALEVELLEGPPYPWTRTTSPAELESWLARVKTLPEEELVELAGGDDWAPALPADWQERAERLPDPFRVSWGGIEIESPSAEEFLLAARTAGDLPESVAPVVDAMRFSNAALEPLLETWELLEPLGSRSSRQAMEWLVKEREPHGWALARAATDVSHALGLRAITRTLEGDVALAGEDLARLASAADLLADDPSWLANLNRGLCLSSHLSVLLACSAHLPEPALRTAQAWVKSLDASAEARRTIVGQRVLEHLRFLGLRGFFDESVADSKELRRLHRITLESFQEALDFLDEHGLEFRGHALPDIDETFPLQIFEVAVRAENQRRFALCGLAWWLDGQVGFEAARTRLVDLRTGEPFGWTKFADGSSVLTHRHSDVELSWRLR